MKSDEMEVTGEAVVEEVIDDLKVSFEDLEDSESNDANYYKLLLLNPRLDDAAVKIKEQSIYK
jgi:hypothetical protein